MKDTNVPVEKKCCDNCQDWIDGVNSGVCAEGGDCPCHKSVPVEKLKKEFFDRFERKYGSFLTEEQVILRAYIWSEIELSTSQAIQAAKDEVRKEYKDIVRGVSNTAEKHGAKMAIQEERKRIAEEVNKILPKDWAEKAGKAKKEEDMYTGGFFMGMIDTVEKSLSIINKHQ